MTLTDKVLSYQNGRWNWRDLWKDLLLTVDQFLELRHIPPEIHAILLNNLTPRLTTMVESFKYYGKSFEALLFTSLRFQIKSAYRIYNDEIKNNETLLIVCSQESILREQTEPCWFEANKKKQEIKKVLKLQSRTKAVEPELQKTIVSRFKPFQRRILIIALKNANALDDGACIQLGDHLGLDPLWLMDCRDELRDSIRQRLESVAKIQNACNALHFISVSKSREAMDRTREAEQFKTLNSKKKQAPVFPRHEDISRLTGIPKGSIDSSLFYVRKLGEKALLKDNGISKIVE